MFSPTPNMNYDRTDIVFVVEKSVSLKRYLPELLEGYIQPIISFFGSGLSEESDVFFSQSSFVQYAAVFFGSELSLIGSWGQVETYGPTPSERDILNAIKDARYTCKNLTRQAFILEGLQAALNLFESMKHRYPPGENVQNVQRCCILVTQSTPMTNPWSPTGPEKVLLELKRCGIQLSVISAHKLVELYRLFDAAGGDYQACLAKNYASKPQHLVLLKDITLQERALSPSLITYTPAPSTVPTPPAPHGPGSAQGPGPSPNPLVPGVAASSPGPVTAGSPIPTPQQPAGMVRPPNMHMNQNPQVNIPNPPQTTGVPGLGPGVAPRLPQSRPRWMVPDPSGQWAGGTVQRPGMPPGVVNMPLGPTAQRPLQPDQMGPKVPPSLPNSDIRQPVTVGNIPVTGAQPPGVPQPGVACVVPGVPGVIPGIVPGMNPPNPPNQRSVVWEGTLEWQEKKADNNSRVSHQVTCKMTSLLVNGEPEVKTDGWASKLIMQMIPKHILGSIGNTFFKNVKTVMFLPDQTPALDILTTFLFRGMAGCVHVSHTTPTQSEVKVIILLFSSEKKAYVGFIPVDQFSFVNKIKSVIQSARKGQIPGSIMSPTSGTSVPGGTPVMVVQNSSGMQQLPTNSGTGMNVLSPQSMIIQQNPQLTQALSQPIQQGGSAMMGGGQMSQMGSAGVSQNITGSGPAGPVNVQMGTGPSVLASQLTTRPTLMQQQQQQQQPDQDKMQLLQMRQNQQQTQQQQQQHHNVAIRQQLQQQLQQRPLGVAMGGMGGNSSLGQPRMMQPPMQNPGLRQLLQQQVRQQQQLQHQQQHQQQQQQQQQIIMMQQQGMRPQLGQQGGQVMGQTLGQGAMGGQGMGQQGMGQQGMGQSIQDSNDYMVDLL